MLNAIRVWRFFFLSDSANSFWITHRRNPIRPTMKYARAFLVILLISVRCACADVIAQWNFNSAPADGNTSTGTNVPSVGNGTASLLGGLTASYTSGTGSSDPASSTDDSAWSTTGYPPLAANNKTAG